MSSQINRLTGDLTLAWLDIEHWQRDNPSISRGYRRQGNSYSASIASLFYIHNESVNVYTHLVGSLSFAVLAGLVYRRLRYAYTTVDREDVATLACFFFGAVSCLSMSSMFHLISNHSYAVAKWGNQLDYLGIVLLIWGSFVPSIYYGFIREIRLMLMYLFMITAIALATAYVTLSPSFRSPEWRVIRTSLFIAMGLSGIFPVSHGIFVFGINCFNRHISLGWMISQGILYITGATIYAARVPERFSPGRFDILGSSHQIFHLFVLMAAYTHMTGLIKAFHHKHNGPNAWIKVSTRRKMD